MRIDGGPYKPGPGAWFALAALAASTGSPWGGLTQLDPIGAGPKGARTTGKRRHPSQCNLTDLGKEPTPTTTYL